MSKLLQFPSEINDNYNEIKELFDGILGVIEHRLMHHIAIHMKFTDEDNDICIGSWYAEKTEPHPESEDV